MDDTYCEKEYQSLKEAETGHSEVVAKLFAGHLRLKMVNKFEELFGKAWVPLRDSFQETQSRMNKKKQPDSIVLQPSPTGDQGLCQPRSFRMV